MCDPRIAFFDSIAPLWDGWHADKPVVRLLADELCRTGVGPAETVLDVGCGTGFLTEALVGHLGPEGRVYALDFSDEMLARARRKVRDSRVAWLRASAERMPLADGACDRAICYSVWPHFRDQAAAVAELSRVLKPDGVVQVLHLISRREVNTIHGQAKDPSVHADMLAPVAEVASFFENAGFEVLATEDADARYSMVARKGRGAGTADAEKGRMR